MIRRARILAVLGMLVPGILGVIAATQTWIAVVVADGAQDALVVPGAEAVPVLTPLSLAALALAGALSITGVVLRYVFAVIAVAIAVPLGIAATQIALGPPLSAVAPTVTTATGIAGADAVADLVASTSLTPWPIVTIVCQVLLAAAGVFTVLTARRWRGGAGRKYSAESSAPGQGASRPHDAIDSWDDLSRGADPTS